MAIEKQIDLEEVISGVKMPDETQEMEVEVTDEAELEAAEAMKLSAQDLLKLGVIDDIIPEPLGGAHRNHDEIAQNIKDIILENLNFFENMSSEEIFDHRKNKFLKIGRGGGFSKSPMEGESGLEFKEPIFLKLKRISSNNKYILIALGLTIIASIIAFLY